MGSLTPETWLVLTIGAVLGAVPSLLIGAYFWYIRPRKHVDGLTSLVADVSGVGAPAIPDLAHNLSFVFDGVVVPRVTVTVIGVWNSGRGAVTRAQLRDALFISIRDGVILKAGILASSVTTNCAKVTVQNKRSLARAEFDYLNEGEGFCVQIIHTSGSNAVELSGTIVGQAGGIIRYVHPAQDAGKRALTTSVFVTVMALAIGGLSSAIVHEIAGPNTWLYNLGPASTAGFFMAWVLFSSSPDRKIKRLPEVIRDSPGLLAAGWPDL